MSIQVLEQLKSEEFALSIGFLSTPCALRRFLHRSEEVAATRRALREGAIADDTIREFVSLLMRDLRYGERFPHELPLAALAVALELRPTDFAEELLRDLSALRLAEMGLCIRVARECLSHRKRRLATNTAKISERAPVWRDVPFSVDTAPSNCSGSRAAEVIA